MGESTSKETFYAVCRDCGELADESKDHTRCVCGGVFHVDAARCMGCGGRHHFHKVGDTCDCGGDIAPKMAECPGCHARAPIEKLGELCPGCNIQMVLEG